MSFSLNEVKAISTKAARGASYTWGIAEEIGRATVWLHRNGQDGCLITSDVLRSGYALEPSTHSPDINTTHWSSNATLCPFLTGVCLADCAFMLSSGPLYIQNLGHAWAIIPFVAMAAQQIESPIEIAGRQFKAVVDAEVLEAVNGRAIPDAITLSISSNTSLSGEHHNRARPSQEAFDVLQDFAAKTYAPASEESRRLGAGAGTTDND